MYSEKSCVRMDKAEILDFAVEFIKKQKYRQAGKNLRITPNYYAARVAYYVQN